MLISPMSHDGGRRPWSRLRSPGVLLAGELRQLEEIASLGVEKDAVPVHAVLPEHNFESNRVLAPLVLGGVRRLDQHAKGLAEHDISCA